ncbi:hypothetical protein [Streptomyces roseochromogenus]|uniref:Uncharacterized protein n=1 Tax=Streptomyces roseochromogenus subsp. oscitans DS 12.976 TaxID=1352936 RepID=V6JEW4_STRRC|nr:hypothetical protein M878_44860 [Streptomyces roseochromogenus subsp. oscitans DS 12.976]
MMSSPPLDVMPDGVVEGLVDVVAVDPRDFVELSVGEADPDLAGVVGVVGVVVDLPLAVFAGDTGALAAVGVQDVVVVGAVVEADAAFGDGLPPHGQQFEVVGPGQRDGHVAADGDERGPHLVRREGGFGKDGVAQSVMGPVLPAAGDPFVEEVL